MISFNTRLVVKTMGALLLIESFFLALASAVSWLYDDADEQTFFISTLITLVASITAMLFGYNAPRKVGEREGYVIVALVWIVCSIFGLLPFYLSGQISTLTDAWFETMSGFTTTGATILTDIECLSHGALFWRSIMQWLGGMGIIVLSIAILPMFGLGGMQLYAAEMNGLSYEKLSPRIADTAKALWITYILLTGIVLALYHIEGMPIFDAICHSFTTIATGGFSTKNASMAAYSPLIQYTCIFFMALSGINYGLLILLFRGRPGRLIKDEETHWYLSAVFTATAVIMVGLMYQFWQGNWTILSWPLFLTNWEQSFREALFTTVATITSTGYGITDYMLWPSLLWVMVFFMMFTGASSGSTSGGLKWVRIGIFLKSGLVEFHRRIHPNAVVPVKINGKPITQQTTNNVMAFMVFYIVILVAGTLCFCALGVDFDESIGAAVSMLNNIGPAIGQYGVAGTFATFPWIGKWLLTLLMLIGRLEIFTVLLLFTKALWR